MGYCMKIVNDVSTEVVTGDEDFLLILEKENPGTWVYDINNQGGKNYTDNVFWERQPYPSWTLDSNKDWQPPTPKDNDVWLEDILRWGTLDEMYALYYNKVARDYLDSTDWYIIRNTETGVVIPTDILTKRQTAREAIV